MQSRFARSGHHATCIWPVALIVWGPGSLAGPHTHDCTQLCLALVGALRVRAGARGRARWRHCHAVVTKANATHEIDGSGALVLSGFIEPHSPLAAAVAALTRREPAAMPLDEGIGIVPHAEAARWRKTLGDPRTLDGGGVRQWVISTLLGHSAPPPVDRRVGDVLGMLRAQTLDARSTSLARLSRRAGLSPSRFAHVFASSMGCPVRRYMRWLRLQRAARDLARGHSATHAAHVAGFADAAHLTRTFRRLLGATPRDLIRAPTRSSGVARRSAS